MTDHATPRCAHVREALSAHLDGEVAALSRSDVDGHLEACEPCAAHAAALACLHRTVRVTAAEPVPDLTDTIVAALGDVPAPTPRAAPHRPARRTAELRCLVAFAGVVQLGHGLAVLLELLGPGFHVARDLGALQVALGIGLLVAAREPWRAAGLLPVTLAVATVAVVVAAADLATGAASLLDEVSHLGELVGVVALWALHRRYAGPRSTAPLEAA